MKHKKKLYKSVTNLHGFELEIECHYFDAEDWHINKVTLYRDGKRIAELYDLLDNFGCVDNMFNIDWPLEAAEQAADMADFSSSE